MRNAAVAALAIALMPWQTCLAQFGAANIKEGTQWTEPVFQPPDREVLRMLATAKELLKQERYPQAVRALASILNPSVIGQVLQDQPKAEQDYFVKADQSAHPEEGQRFGSLKSEARQLLARLPKAAREYYELEYGGPARQILQRAIASGDVETVSEVARRYPHTHAGYDATMLLGRFHLDHGRALAAALCFEQVYETPGAAAFESALSMLCAASWQRAGYPDRARQILVALKARSPRAAIEIGGRKIPLFDRDEDEIAWLTRAIGQEADFGGAGFTDWLMFRGNASRAGWNRGGRPLLSRPQWQQRVTYNAPVEVSLDEQKQLFLDRGAFVVPSLQPLAVGNTIITRGPGRLAAIDLSSGKIVWQVETEDIGAEDAQPEEISDSSLSSLAERVWLDKTYGTISSDGDRVFVLQEFASGKEDQRRTIIDPFGNRLHYTSSQYNVLAAYDMANSQGKLLWSVGGPDEGTTDMSTAFFLGPPLPMNGRLYTIAEISGEIRLIVLDARSGARLWSQQLAVVQTGSYHEIQRRTGGISPSFAEGVLVCPTGVGAVVAVDLASRSLLWGYQYPEPEEDNRFQRAWAFRRQTTQTKPEELWADCCAVIWKGQVIITPAESTKMFCLSLRDGSLQWYIDRENYAYLACVTDGKAFVVGRDEVTAVKLLDPGAGKVVDGWPIKLPDGAMPSGRGFLAEGRYYLPLLGPIGGEVATIDLQQAKIVDRVRSRDGMIPGNLICFRDQVISQSTDLLQSFFQLEALQDQVDKRLKANPEDPWALVRRGEILFDQGQIDEAVPLFREARRHCEEILKLPETAANFSVRLEADENRLIARELLLGGLLDGLRQDFVANRKHLSEIESLIAGSAEQVDYLRIKARGLETAGEIRDALLAYFELAETVSNKRPLIAPEPGHSVRLDRWLQARLARLHGQLPDDQHTHFDEEILAHQDKAIADGSETALRQFVDFFGWHAAAVEVKQQLAGRRGARNHLQREQLLIELARAGDPEGKRNALAQLADLYLQAKHFREATHYYDQLRTQYPDDVCWQGKTGQQLFDELPASSSARESNKAEWPQGLVEETASERSNARRIVSFQPPFMLKMFSGKNPTHEKTRVVIDQQQLNNIVGLDGFGNQRWAVSLGSRQRRTSFGMNAGFSCGRTDGSLLVLSVGRQVMAIDMLGARQGGESAVLWRQNVTQRVSTSSTTQYRHSPLDLPPWGDQSTGIIRRGDTIAKLGPITPGGVSFLRNRDLISVDPMSGETLWVRRGLGPDVELFGDDEYLFVAAPDANEALVLSAIDGSSVGRANLPPASLRWTIVGRNLLVWRKGDDESRQIAMYDPWTEKDIWSHDVSRNAKGDLIGEEALVVMERDGRLRIIELTTGRLIADQEMLPEPALKGLYVIPSSDAYIVVTNQGASPDNPDDRAIKYYAMPQQQASAFITGRVYAIDRDSGLPLWKTPATIRQYGLLLNQPPETPVLAFARRVANNRRGTSLLSFLFIDKRTGQLAIPAKEINNRDNNFELAADHEAKTVSVFFMSRGSNFTLKFTDKPRPEEPPFKAAETGLAPVRRINENFGAALKAFKKIAEAAKKPKAEDPFDAPGAEDDKAEDLFGDP